MKPVLLLKILTPLLFISVSATAQLVRQENNTLNFPLAPTTQAGQWSLRELFATITFDRPVAIATPPGETNRLFVVERAGRIWMINDLANPTKELFLDISSRVHAADWVNNRRTEGLSSVAFHPDFASNHRFFVSYNTVTNTSQGDGHHNRVSEFRASNDNRDGIESSEIFLITQYDEGDGHNINDLHFGPDGYLFIASGDEGDGGTGDDFNNAQKIDKDFFSAIMRIDVDNKSGNLTPNSHPAANTSAFRIPPDNPYVGSTSFNGLAVNPANVRTEFYAVGVRNPWRISFDPLTAKIFEGDVGQHGREEINIIVKGGNYGWPYKEGALNGPKGPPSGFSSIDPIFQYGTGFGPMDGFSVTGGVVDRRANSQLYGHLIFADYVSGNVWAMNIDAQPPTAPARLLGETGIASFGYDPRTGEVLVVNHDQGKIKRLRYETGPDNVPQTLADTGVFSNLTNLTANPGIYGYSVNSPLWSDGALKRRWFHIADGKTMTFSPEGNWSFPSGSIWVKHFEATNAAATIRIETRVLVKTDSSVYGVTYAWNDEGTAAALVPEAGGTRTIPGTGQTWRFPSRSECLSCHTEAAGRVLGFTSAQMNRVQRYGSISSNQIEALSAAGFFTNPQTNLSGLRALAAINDASVSRTYRARSYLTANCSQCHQPGANVHSSWDARVTTPLSAADIIYGALANGPADHKVVTPGITNLSAILTRMKMTGAGRMPPLGVNVPDAEAIALLTDWIGQDLREFESFEAWSARLSAGAKDADPDNDGILNFTEYLWKSDPKAPNAPNSPLTITRDLITFEQPAHRGFVLEKAANESRLSWRIWDHPQNVITFPAQATPRSFTNVLDGVSGFLRLRVVEP